ncbi:SusC/RagA family TonB-linked outer membrane protein [Pseudoflavitalea sp. X16]|uniref:SusC/RagA family TonB-linked outer membrane protein n=1 Tax=Paraflavitalea devenefica TaxID=2716334 RepID=UPI0014235211|nr:SusC/RagA family TonB-linked outer membrane protein [Paraflavitalea devenefica]NII27767.1 SusC/RagA family TonB-linked outer membrane protein [Paraflavitalea devenefica]
MHLQSFFTGESQVVSLSFKEAPLQKVFAEIRKQTGYSFAYFETDLARAKLVNVNITNARVQDALRTIFQDQPLTYTIIEKVVVVKQKTVEKKINQEQSSPPPFLPIEVRGRVLNEREDPVAGVTVQVKGTKTGTATDGEGEFFLKNVESNATLVLTGVNIEPVEKPINGQRNLDLRVKGRSSKLDEVQVIAYGRTSQRFSTGNVTTIKAEDIEKQPVSNPLFALQGRVPGLLVTQNTGLANGAFKVRIQGQNSITTSNNSPLIVVDGVPLSNDLLISLLAGPLAVGTTPESRGNNPVGFINPGDIESIDVLKDADATAIYGSRAANGAVLITTKRGKAGKTKVTVGVQQGWSKVTRKLDLLNTRQYLDMRYEAIRNDGLTIGNTAAYTDLVLWDTTRYTDWQEALIGGTANYTNISTSVSGGSPTTQYLVGGTYNKQTTVFPGAMASKSGTLHFTINTASTNQKFKLSLTGNYTVNDNGIPGADLTSIALQLAPNAPPLYNADGTLNWALNAAGNATWENPLINSFYRDYEHVSKQLLSNAQLSYTILPGLLIKSSLGYNSTLVNSFYGSTAEAVSPANRRNTARSSIFGNSTATTWLIEPQLTYNKKWGKGILDVLAGTTLQKTVNDIQTISASGFSSDLLLKDISSALDVTSDYRQSIYLYSALFGRINLNWDNRYVINVAARRDGSSRFGANNLFNNFWSVGAAWIFTEEKGIKELLPMLSFGKIRASYGTTGSDGIGDYLFLSRYASTTSGIPYQEVSGLQSTGLENPYIQWEEVRKLQGGIDLVFFNDRILLNATFARNRSSNQLVNYALPAIAGRTSVRINLPALIQNTSWEFSLSATPLKTSKITWTSSLNLTIPRNKLIEFPGIENTSYATGTSGVIIGQPLGATYYFHYLGVDPLTGRYLFADQKGNPVVVPSGQALSVLLSFQPQYYGGWMNTITYKRLSLDFLFQFIRQLGNNSFYLGPGAIPGNFSVGLGNQSVSVLNRWQKPGDNAPIGRYSTSSFAKTISLSDAGYSYDASYIRLKNVSLSWQLPPGLLKKVSLQSGVLYFRGQNLATITHYTGLDPESQGTSLPPLQVWTLGFNVSF